MSSKSIMKSVVINTAKILNPPSENLENELSDSEKSSTEELITTNSMIYAYEPGHYHNKMTIPMETRWAFGIGVNARVINLTKSKYRIKLFYAVSHIGVMYDDSLKTMRFLVGHKNTIISTSSDSTGKWIVTADSEIEHSIVVWDSDECVPVHTIYEPHIGYGTVLVCLSYDGKYLVSIGREVEPIVKFWLWTYGQATEDGSYKIKRSYGEVQDITFNPNENNHFAITFSEAVIFFSWDTKFNHWIPDMRAIKSRNYGTFQSSTYLEYSHECLTSTSKGWVVIWGISFYDVPFESVPLNNNKMFIRAIRLQSDPITCLCDVDGIIITGDVKGHIKFYDTKMKIIYWAQNFKLNCIYSIRFNLIELDEDKRRHTTKQYALLGKKDENLPVEDDRSHEFEKLHALPSDFTLQRNPFLVRDFIVVTTKGDVAYVDFVAGKLNSSLSPPYSEITSLAVHDEKPILCIGYANGVICSFNYKDHKLIFQEVIMNSKDIEYNEITCIKYSPKGLYLACSTAGGHLWFLEPSIIKHQTKKPFIYDHSRISAICFSHDNRYVAYYDSSMAVCLLKRYESRTDGLLPDWVFHGRYIAHYKQIADFLFCNSSRLFSIGYDRCLVEYDVEESEPGKLELISRTTAMQTGYPLCFIQYHLKRSDDPENNDNRLLFLISSSEYKYYIINENGCSLEQTILAPTIENPVKEVTMVPYSDEKYMIFSTDRYLGIQKVPVTGNPFKRVAMVAHPVKIGSFLISNCGQYVFTYGKNDNVCLMWNLKFASVEYMKNIGGRELNPYYSLIEGGVNGWLFHEMRDMFYYMQILHDGEDSPLPRKTYEKIPTSELPNLIRAIGFFPSEEELDNILYEVKYYYATSNELNVEEITFENFVKIYINHRPVNKFCLDEIYSAFNTFAEQGKINREQFVNVLINKGEPFTQMSLLHCLSILLSISKGEDEISKNDFSILPEQITYENLIINTLGIEMDKSQNN